MCSAERKVIIFQCIPLGKVNWRASRQKLRATRKTEDRKRGREVVKVALLFLIRLAAAWCEGQIGAGRRHTGAMDFDADRPCV